MKFSQHELVHLDVMTAKKLEETLSMFLHCKAHNITYQFFASCYYLQPVCLCVLSSLKITAFSGERFSCRVTSHQSGSRVQAAISQRPRSFLLNKKIIIIIRCIKTRKRIRASTTLTHAHVRTR